jgi:hypothetical protein
MARLMDLAKLLKGPVIALVLFYFVGGGVVYSMLKLTDWVNTHPYAAGTPDNEGSFEKAVDAYQNVNSLLTTLATGLLAALGFLLINRPGRPFSAWDFWWAATSALCACVSLYWGYVSSQNVQVALEFQSLTLDLPTLQFPRQFQFYSVVLGVICLAHFAMRTAIAMSAGGGESHAGNP